MTAPRILSIGDIDVDTMVAVPTLPAHDGKVSGHRLGDFPGGMAANVAVALARLGHPARMLGAVGDDPEGQNALGGLQAAGVDTGPCVVRADTATFVCFVLLTPGGEKALVRLETPAFMPRPGDLTEAAFADIDHVHINYGDPDLAAASIGQAAAAGATVSLDLEVADLPDDDTAPLVALLPQVSVLFVNAAAAARLAHIQPGQDGPQAIVTTRGRHGATYADSHQTVSADGVTVTSQDTTGAGDCFAAAFLARYLAGAGPQACLAEANAAAALSTRAYGAQTAAPTQAELSRFREGLSAGLDPDAALRQAIEERP